MRANTDWFMNARWGLFFCYFAEIHISEELLETDQGPAEWNRLIDGFDVEGLAQQAAELQTGYIVITVGQNSGYYLSPNATYDGLVGREPSRLSRRDLVADLAAALAQVGIPLMVYLPSLAPCRDLQAIRKLRCTPPWGAERVGFPPESIFPEDAARTDERMTEFQQNWEAIIREWSLRWGRSVRGWNIDGCYVPDKLYQHPDPPNFASFAAAVKAGNPDSLVGFNPGVRNPVISLTDQNDYTVGEVSHALPISGEAPCVFPLGRWLDGAQYHLNSFLGGGWGYGQPRLSDEMVVAYTRYVNGWGGVIDWDIPTQPSGLIRERFFQQLQGLSN
jgi:hypothetical protein